MNNKIKIYDLINRIHENKDVPKIIKYEDEKYQYKEDVQDYKKVSNYYIYLFETIIKEEKWLDVEVEILEDEEEIDIQDIKIFEQPRDLSIWSNDTLSKNQRNIIEKVNKLVKAVKQLDKKINKED